MAGEEWLTLDEVAEQLRVERHTAKRFIEDGLVPYLAVGRIRRIRVVDLEEFIARHTRPARQAPPARLGRPPKRRSA